MATPDTEEVKDKLYPEVDVVVEMQAKQESEGAARASENRESDAGALEAALANFKTQAAEVEYGDAGNTHGGRQGGVLLSQVSMYEPRPGEMTYTHKGPSEGGVSQNRPSMERLRGVKSQNIVDYMQSEKEESDDELGALIQDQKAEDEKDDEKKPKEPEMVKGCCGLGKAHIKKPPPPPLKFGMWDGVFARCLSNIFGVIMFLRVPWLIGYSGFLWYLVVMAVSVLITGLTTISLSAICTNGLVEGGGAYFLISRSLGPAFGGSIGVVFYLANAVAVAMYLIGFSEAILSILKEPGGPALLAEGWDLRLVSLITLVLVLVLCITSLKLVSKLQVILLGIVIVSMVAFFIGVFIEKPEMSAFRVPWQNDAWQDNMLPDWDAKFVYSKLTKASNYTQQLKCADPNDPKRMLTAKETLDSVDGKVDFGMALGVFFPAVTGIMAGANISGDLKDPSTAIPKGTLLSIFLSTIAYVFLGLAVAGVGVRSAADFGDVCPFGGLMHDSTFMAKASVFAPIVYAGIFLCTLNAGVATLVGAPRILQALSKDEIFPGTNKIFGGGWGPNAEPVAAYALTFLLASGCILIGNLNAIAPLITNFFMISYALTNFACFMASASKSPGWRPTFRWYNRYASLACSVACIAIMLFLDQIMGFISILIGAGLYLLVWKLDPKINWGSATEGYQYINALRAQSKLLKTQEHVKNWRPQILVLLPFNPRTAAPKEYEIRKNSMNMDAEAAAKVIAEVKSNKVPPVTSALGQDIRTCSLALLVRDLKKVQGCVIAGHVRIVEQPLRLDLVRRKSDGNVQTVSEEDEKKVKSNNPFKLSSECRRLLDCTLTELNVKAFTEVVTANDLRAGVHSLIEVSGMGKMRPNTLIMGFPESWQTQSDEDLINFVGVIGDAFDCKYGIAILRYNRVSYQDISKQDRRGPVDVWWLSDDGGLTILLPHLMLKSKAWRESGAEMRMMNALREDRIDQAGPEMTRLDNLVKKFRIKSTVQNVTIANPEDPSEETVKEYMKKLDGRAEDSIDSVATKIKLRMGEVIADNSQNSSLVVVSMPVPHREKQTEAAYCRMYLAWLDAMSQSCKHCPTLLIHGNQDDALTFYT